MKHLLSIAVLVFAACKSGDSKSDHASKGEDLAGSRKVVDDGVAKRHTQEAKVVAIPCDPGAADFAKKLSDANGYNMDLSKPETQKTIETAKAELAGKTFAFNNCLFSSQGNDEVSFKAATDAQDISCAMKGGDAGNKKFRDAAMNFDMAKLRLDVHGTLEEHGQLHTLQLVDCEITPHE